MIRLVAAVADELGDLDGVALGVGPLRAAAAMARSLARARPRAVLLVGSAGAYPGGPPVGAVVSGGRLGWCDGASAVGAAYTPLPPPPLQADADLSARLGLTAAAVLTVPAITTDPAMVAALAHSAGGPWAVEHLEATAVALACAAAGVPFACALGIANRVGPDAHAEWKANRAAAEAGARAAARRALEG